MSSRQEVKVEHKVSVAAFTSRDVKWVGEGREVDTTEERSRLSCSSNGRAWR